LSWNQLCRLAYANVDVSTDMWLQMRLVMSIAQSHIWGANWDWQGGSVLSTTLKAHSWSRLPLSFQWPFMHGAAHAIFVWRAIYRRWQTSFSVLETPSFLCTSSIGLDTQHPLGLIVIIWLSTQHMQTWTDRLLSSLKVLQHKSSAVSAKWLSGPSCSMSDSSCRCRTKRI